MYISLTPSIVLYKHSHPSNTLTNPLRLSYRTSITHTLVSLGCIPTCRT